MNPAQRLVVNTLAQQIRSVLNVCLALYSTRLVLEALGQSDYGIYSLIGGVVSMQSFLTNALVITTQRYFSFYQGRGNKEELLKVFSNSIFIHVVIGLVIVLIFAMLEPYVINHMLKIPTGRTEAAVVTYVAVVCMLVMTFLTAPFRALFIARENIVFISVTDVIDGIIKVLIALYLTSASGDKLVTYVHLIPLVSLFNLLALSTYSALKYKECHIPKLRELDKSYLRQLGDFAGWTIYSTGCIMGRAQGLAIVFNRFRGTVMNAAYGIAMQISASVLFVAQAVTNATSPQIVKAEGAYDRDRMILLASKASKFSTLMLAVFCIPLIFEMPHVLGMWLKEYPEHTVTFCRFILASCLCDQLTMGLNQANQAIGKIRNYSLLINTFKLLTLPAAIVCLYLGAPVVSTMWCYLGIELTCAFLRLPYMKITAGFSVSKFVHLVFFPLIPSLVTIIIVDWLCVNYIPEFSFRFVCTGVLGILAMCGITWNYTLDSDERVRLRQMLSPIFRKVC